MNKRRRLIPSMFGMAVLAVLAFVHPSDAGATVRPSAAVTRGCVTWTCISPIERGGRPVRYCPPGHFCVSPVGPVTVGRYCPPRLFCVHPITHGHPRPRH